jgi:hypothetical protein
LWEVPRRKATQSRGPPLPAAAEVMVVYAESQVVEDEEALYTESQVVEDEEAYYLPEYQ